MSLALIMGDTVYAFGNDIIFNSPFPKERIFAALSRLQNIVTHTIYGEARDVYMEYRRSATEKEILGMYQNKTARYTVEGPLHIGGMLAGASEEVMRGFSAYALPIGIAFQIQDDILGMYGSAERVGKPAGSDIKEGKITLLVSRALQKGKTGEKKRIEEILRRGEKLSEEEIEEFKELLKKTGGYESCQASAAEYIKEGQEALRTLEGKITPRAYDFLFSVSEYMMKREY
jgi:geranylgeranyl diphosphate synthase type I